MEKVRVLETEDLILRAVRQEDLEDIFDYGRDPEVARYVTWPEHKSIEDSQTFLDFVMARYEKGDYHIRAIVEKSSGKMIGTIDFVKGIHPHNWAELAYVLNRSYWGRGIMTQAAKAVLAYGFDDLNLNRIFARAIDLNKGSYRVMEKLGMTYEGRTRQVFKDGDTYYDVLNYSILRDEYESMK